METKWISNKNFLMVLLFTVMLQGCVTNERQRGVEKHIHNFVNISNLATTAPEYALGDRWQYDDGMVLKVVEKNSDGTVKITLDEREIYWEKWKDLQRIESKTPNGDRKLISSTNGNSLFPMQSGAKPKFKRTYLSNGRQLTHESQWVVLGQEQIATPAGDFECWVLLWKTANPESKWSGQEKWWYAPKVRQYVRMEYDYNKEKQGVRRLTAYHLAGGEEKR